MSKNNIDREPKNHTLRNATAALVATVALVGCANPKKTAEAAPTTSTPTTELTQPSPSPEVVSEVQGIEQIRTDMLAYTQSLAELIEANAQEKGVAEQLSGNPNTTIYEFTKQGSDETLEVIINKSSIDNQVESLSISREETTEDPNIVTSTRAILSPLDENGELAAIRRETVTATPAPVNLEETGVILDDSQTADWENLHSWKQIGTEIRIGGVDGGEKVPASPETYKIIMDGLTPYFEEDLTDYGITA